MGSWKSLFYHTKNERIGIIILLILILFSIIAPAIHKRISVSTPKDFTEFIRAVEAFEKERIAGLDKEMPDIDRRINRNERLELRLKNFDPNTISLDCMIDMGLPERLSTTIDNFRRAGGQFRKKEDLRRIFGMSDYIYDQINRYVVIPNSESTAKTKEIVKKEEIVASVEQVQKKADIPSAVLLKINLNEADSADLMKIRGIGQVFSNRIIRYRELLGGFFCTSQLLEVYGMDSARYNAIKDNVFVEGYIYGVNINKAEFSDLVKHPYIDRNVANSIVMMRKQHGNYKSIEDVKRSYLIKDELFARIKHYLVTED